MQQTLDGLKLGQRAKYQIIVQGKEVEAIGELADGLAVQSEVLADGPAITVFTGLVRDQAALHGILNRIRDLSIPLLSVELIEPPLVKRRSE